MMVSPPYAFCASARGAIPDDAARIPIIMGDISKRFCDSIARQKYCSSIDVRKIYCDCGV